MTPEPLSRLPGLQGEGPEIRAVMEEGSVQGSVSWSAPTEGQKEGTLSRLCRALAVRSWTSPLTVKLRCPR